VLDGYIAFKTPSVGEQFALFRTGGINVFKQLNIFILAVGLIWCVDLIINVEREKKL
jgi:hypothetical protein